MTKKHSKADVRTKDKDSKDNEIITIRILLADDHNLVREGFRLLLEREPSFVVIGEAKSGKEALILANTLRPDVILMDISMHDFNGLVAAHKILIQNPAIKIIILSVSDNEEFILQAIQIGVLGYLLKENASQELIKAVREVGVNGNPYYVPAVQKKIFEIQNRQLAESKDEVLTLREREVLQLVAEGKKTPEIAELLLIGSKTVGRHRQNLMDKLGIHDVVGLTHYAIKKGIIPP